MNFADRIARDHERLAEIQAVENERAAAAVAVKRARMADDSGTNTAVSPAKMST